MNCPRCSAALAVRQFKDIEVDRCPDCKGIWLDYHEMEDLEDSAVREDIVKGMRDYARGTGDLPCPHCSAMMDVFNYRAHNLPIEHCPNDHGLLAGPRRRRASVGVDEGAFAGLAEIDGGGRAVGPVHGKGRHQKLPGQDQGPAGGLGPGLRRQLLHEWVSSIRTISACITATD